MIALGNLRPIPSGETLESELAGNGARLSTVALELPEDLDEQTWAHLVRRLVRASQVVQWWIGDWAAFGDRKYGRLKEFCIINQIPPQTVYNASSVSRAIEPTRRRANVPWTLHEAVASLEPASQTVWLEKIEKEAIPRSELRHLVRLERGERDGLESDGPGIRLAVNACDELTAWLRSLDKHFWTAERDDIWWGRLRPISETFTEISRRREARGVRS